jgi:lysophospholipase L1-like esterase
MAVRRSGINAALLGCGWAVLVAAVPLHAGPAAVEKFDFGGGKAKSGWIHVAPTNFYSDAAGFGFEPGAEVAAEKKFMTSDKPFYFSVKEPEGNYKVTATFAGESTMTVKAELRRLMLEKIHTPAGKFTTRSFIVNIRTPKIAGDGEVHLKPRETTNEWWAWDDKLTLEFNGQNPSLRSLQIRPVKVPTVFILGDSTVCDQPDAPWNSWGQMLPRFFKPDIAIANHAESGETIAGSLAAGRFAKVFSLMKPGDYLIIQFGHNDMKNKRPGALERYKEDFKKVIAETRAQGGTPVLVTSMERKAGVKAPTLMGYPAAVREVAKEEHCALIDLNAMSLVFYRALGTNLDKAFVDGTHHDNYGSYELAKCVLDGIKQDKLPLAKFIVKDFKGFDLAHPDNVQTFQMTVSPRSSSARPLGN